MKPAQLMERQCAQDLPSISGFICEPCKAPAAAESFVKTMDCPGCGACVQRVSGCAHITCTCGVHFCWRCGKNCGDAAGTYAHLLSEHGGYFFLDDAEQDEEEEEED